MIGDRVTPLVLVPACHRQIGMASMAVVGTSYLDAVRQVFLRPLVVPSAGASEVDSLLDLADGIYLTGSPSNVHPSHFGQDVRNPELPLDDERDAWTLPLIRAAIRLGIPMLGICRGFQEFNVALGGSLHQSVHELPGMMDHRPASEETMDGKFAPAHEIEILLGGFLEGVLGKNRIMVNSVHGQGIDRLAASLRAEAFAPDGLIEAITVPDAPAFNLGVQWHPEWRAAENPASARLFETFATACRERRAIRNIVEQK